MTETNLSSLRVTKRGRLIDEVKYQEFSNLRKTYFQLRCQDPLFCEYLYIFKFVSNRFEALRVLPDLKEIFNEI